MQNLPIKQLLFLYLVGKFLFAPMVIWAQCSDIVQNLKVGYTFQNSVYFQSEEVGFVAGGGGLSKTLDGGNTWKQFNIKGAGNNKGVRFLESNKSIGLITAYNGFIAKTKDGGETWQTQASGVPHLIRIPFLVSETEYWAVGDSGTVLHTTDGGNTWLPAQGLNLYGHIRAVHFIDQKLGFVGGNYGQLMRTTDGGQTWAKMVSDSTNFYAFSFAEDNKTGWAVGGMAGWNPGPGANTIYKTNDAGATWVKYNSPMVTARGVKAISADTVYICGTGGVFKSNDGGITWSKIQAGARSAEYVDMYFPSKRVGYACGSNSAFIKITTQNTPPQAAIIQNGNTLIAGAGTGFAYQWYLNGDSIPGANTGTFEPEYNGDYRVKVTYNECASVSNAVTITNLINSNAVVLTSNQSIGVYPNPAQHTCYLQVKQTDKSGVFKLVNNLGQVVLEQKITLDDDITTIRLIGIPTGIYSVIFRSAKGIITTKLVVQH